MEQTKFLTVFLLCLGIAGVAWSVEVISIDLNGGDYAAYTGDGAYTSDPVVWRAYYQGTGKPMGSPRSADLPDYDEPNIPSTYAAGVWITDNVANHTYVTDGTDLMDDGFEANVGVSASVSIFANAGGDVNNRDGRAFGGTFDIYVYGAVDGNFTVSNNAYGPTTYHITGGYVSGSFEEGEDFTVFTGVIIGDTNATTLTYDGQLNGIQLVSHKQPVAINSSTTTPIEAEDYDVAFETNTRNDDPCTTRLGADIGTFDTSSDPNETGVGYLAVSESMTYDITVASEDEGIYNITAYVRTPTSPGQDCTGLAMYLDENIALGDFSKTGSALPDFQFTNQLPVHLFAGPHTIKWVCEGSQYYDIDRFEFDRTDEDPNLDNCAEVYQYHYNYEKDFNEDCDVNELDLAYITGDNWLECFDPDPNECP